MVLQEVNNELRKKGDSVNMFFSNLWEGIYGVFAMIGLFFFAIFDAIFGIVNW